MTIAIRHAEESDIPGAYKCLDAVAKEGLWLSRKAAPEIERSRVFWRSLLSSKAPFVVVLDSNNVVGWCDITPREDGDSLGPSILGIGLLPSYREQGYGRRLLNMALDFAEKSHIRLVQLRVRADNLRARRLFESVGFRDDVNRKSEPLNFPSTPLSIQMSLSLSRSSTQDNFRRK